MELQLTNDEVREFLATGRHWNSPGITRAGLGTLVDNGSEWVIVESGQEFDTAMVTYFAWTVKLENGMRLTDQVNYVVRKWIQNSPMGYYPIPSQAQLATLRWRLLTMSRAAASATDIELVHAILNAAAVGGKMSMAQRTYLEYFVGSSSSASDDGDINTGEPLRRALAADLKARHELARKMVAYKHHCVIAEQNRPEKDQMIVDFNNGALGIGYKLLPIDAPESVAAAAMIPRKKIGTRLVIRRLRPAIDAVERAIRVNMDIAETASLIRQRDALLAEEQRYIDQWKRATQLERSIYDDSFLKGVVSGTTTTKRGRPFDDVTFNPKRALFIQRLNNTAPFTPTLDEYYARKRDNGRSEAAKRIVDAFHTNTTSIGMADQAGGILPVDAFVSRGIHTSFGRIK